MHHDNKAQCTTKMYVCCQISRRWILTRHMKLQTWGTDIKIVDTIVICSHADTTHGYTPLLGFFTFIWESRSFLSTESKVSPHPRFWCPSLIFGSQRMLKPVTVNAMWPGESFRKGACKEHSSAQKWAQQVLEMSHNQIVFLKEMSHHWPCSLLLYKPGKPPVHPWGKRGMHQVQSVPRVSHPCLPWDSASTQNFGSGSSNCIAHISRAAACCVRQYSYLST